MSRDVLLDQAAQLISDARVACLKLAPCLVNLQALLNRLSRICRSRMGSTVSCPRFSWASRRRWFLFCSASCCGVVRATRQAHREDRAPCPARSSPSRRHPSCARACASRASRERDMLCPAIPLANRKSFAPQDLPALLVTLDLVS
jgi:hypothetical protein